MTDDTERNPTRSQRPAPPYVRRTGDLWRDELPPITRYLYDDTTEPREPLYQSGAWILEEWEQYDWKKAASLTGDPDIVAAQQAWDDLDWEADADAGGRQRPAELVATILDGLARRIRSGDVRVNGSPGMTDEAALTSVLAALLGVRR